VCNLKSLPRTVCKIRFRIQRIRFTLCRLQQIDTTNLPRTTHTPSPLENSTELLAIARDRILPPSQSVTKGFVQDIDNGNSKPLLNLNTFATDGTVPL
jgi:hypothetical protein